MLTVVDGFAAQARATPEAVAVVSGPRRVSYRELDAVVARLAGQLRHRGVGAGDLVAVALPRSVEMLAAVLAVGRAGAAYLPLDPAYPARRRQAVLADAAPELVLTSADGLGELGASAPAVTLDQLSAPVPPLDSATPAPDDLAYVIFTSGSTGQPKGVAVPHRALANFLLAMREALGSGPQDAWLALATLSFDISTLELFLPLLVGGRTVIVPERLVRDGAGLVRLIRAEGVTHVQATPSGWRILLDGWDGSEPTRVVALAGGEALPLPLAREIRARVQRLYNVYGPTETTVWSTLAELPPHIDEITIGTPIANTCTHLLDHHQHPVPPGTPGELYIGGTGLATGYLHRPELTTQRFLPDPHHGTRMYRTGDLCRQRPDGQLIYLGRLDNQIKLRGHRIELTDIETTLLQHPHIRHAAAAIHGHTNPRLIGYVVGPPPPPQWLRERLPAIMIPTTWVTLDHLPLTPNGKLDRAALPDPPPTPHQPRTQHGDMDQTTDQIRTIWKDVLHIDHIEPDDDLFDLGGHSLTITRIIARIHQQLGVNMPLEVFYDTPTLAEVAAAVRALTGRSEA